MSQRKLMVLLYALVLCVIGGAVGWMVVRGRGPARDAGPGIWARCLAEAYPQSGVVEIAGAYTEVAQVAGIQRTETAQFRWWLGDGHVRVELW